MELNVMENDVFVKYGVQYDKDKMQAFLNDVIKQYGDFYPMQLKLSSEKEILGYCDGYKDLEQIKDVPPVFRKVKKGPNKGIKKLISKAYKVYSFTAIDYPEIFFVLANLLKQEQIDLSVLDAFVEPDKKSNLNNLDYYLEASNRDRLKELRGLRRQFAGDSDMREKYISKVIERRKQQRESISRFLELLDLTMIEQQKIRNLDLIDHVVNFTNLFEWNYEIIAAMDPHMSNYSPRFMASEIIQARHNSELMIKAIAAPTKIAN